MKLIVTTFTALFALEVNRFDVNGGVQVAKHTPLVKAHTTGNW